MYIDTSVLVAYYCPEALSSQVEALLRNQAAPIVSELVEVELSSAIALKVREHELDRSDAFQVLAQFQRHLDDQLYTKLTFDSRHFQLAKTWLGQLQWPLRSLDALHIAAAQIAQTPFVTSDKSLATIAKAIGIDILMISSEKKPKH